MDTNRAMWWGLGIIATIGIAFVFYLFMSAPLPTEYQKDYTAEAKMQLDRVCRMEKDYFAKHGRYTAAMDSVGFYQHESDGGKYWIEMEKFDSSSFVLRAYAREDFDNDNLQSVWETGSDCQPRELQGD